MKCACGKELHYNSVIAKDTVQQLVDRLGEEVKVTIRDKSYMVQRHYIALHGLVGSKLEELSKLGIVKPL
jgi:hypothetical protein